MEPFASGARPAVRVAGKLTVDLIIHSPQHMNAVDEYELSLRGNKIATVENLAATRDAFGCIDLSDNDLVRLEGFPALPKLRTLLVHNNRLMRLGADFGSFLPNLETLILTNNRLTNLVDLDPLSSLPSLMRLSLIGNPVTKQPKYRLYAIHRCCAKLKALDFRKVKDGERDDAEAVFGEEEGAAAVASVAAAARGKGGAGGGTAGEGAAAPAEEPAPAAAGPAKLSAEQQLALQAALANASTLEEIQRLEAALAAGQVPGGGGGLGDDMDED